MLFSGNKMGRCACIAEENQQDDQGLAPLEQIGSNCSSGGVGVGPGDKKWAALKTDVV
jgi:hypothetical protein